MGGWCVIALFAWLISHQPAVLFFQNKPATSNQPTLLYSQNKPAPAISHQPNEQAAFLQRTYRAGSQGDCDLHSTFQTSREFLIMNRYPIWVFCDFLHLYNNFRL
jgi:hypothetical protein